MECADFMNGIKIGLDYPLQEKYLNLNPNRCVLFSLTNPEV